MADRAIVKIEVSDSDDRFRMKVNQNFQQLSRGFVVDGPLRQTINESIELDLQTVINSVLEIVCPVGTIMFTGSMADPRLQRGTWRRIENKFILAASSSHMLNTTGGEETVALTADNNGTHTHTVSTGTVPSHSNDITILSNGLHNDTATVQSDGSYFNTATTATASTVEEVSGDITIDTSGSGTAHENMPPYVSKYCFERIA